MAKTLFDHLNAITDKKDPKYWDKLEDADKKTWSNYMILRFLSMKPEWIETIADIQPYIQNAPPKAMYLALIELIPKTRAFLKYMKPASAEKYEKWVVELVSQYYEVSQLEAEGYLEILYETTNGKLHIKEIAQAYGTDPKEITKLKLKV
jgi:wyosine [tRNA(Phe)-imidazoG37] synthetase (radical SAM superfamily)